MARLVFTGILAVIVYFLVGIINLDNEFYEDPRLFVKIPPTGRVLFRVPPMEWYDYPTEARLEAIGIFEKRRTSYESSGRVGE